MDMIDGMRTFIAVVEGGSLTGGAERLGMSNALVSKYIGQLEDRLRTRLLNRTTRNMALTEAGELFYQRAQIILEDFSDLSSQLRDQHTQPSGHLRVSMPVTYGESHLTPLIGRFLDQFPEITIDMVLADRHVDLTDEGFDLAIRIGKPESSSLIARKLADMRVIACASPGYLAYAGEPTHPNDLIHQKLVVDSNLGNGREWPFQENGRSITIRPPSRLRVNSAAAVRNLLLQDQGIGMCPEYAVRADLKQGRLVALLEDYEALSHTVLALYPHSRYLPSKCRAFIDFLRSELTKPV